MVNQQEIRVSYLSFTEQRSEATLAIVGEASYQDDLATLAGDRGVDGPTNRNFPALLVPEPSNDYDSNAIAIYLLTGAGNTHAAHVGYLSRENALAYGPVFAMLAPAAILAPAKLIGGWVRGDDRGHIGVTIGQLGSASELAAELWSDKHPEVTEHPWRGQLIAFTGESGFAVNGIRLDRLSQQFLAQKAGCKTWPRVTKKCNLCVTSDPENETNNLLRAEEYGLETVRERDFWAGVGYQLEVF